MRPSLGQHRCHLSLAAGGHGGEQRVIHLAHRLGRGVAIAGLPGGPFDEVCPEAYPQTCLAADWMRWYSVVAPAMPDGSRSRKLTVMLVGAAQLGAVLSTHSTVASVTRRTHRAVMDPEVIRVEVFIAVLRLGFSRTAGKV